MEGEVLLIGATGLLGVDVHAEFRSRGWVVDAPPKHILDLEDPRSIDAYFLSARPAWVVNCAAYTAVDNAESEVDRANAMNAVAPYSLARFCRWVRSRFLHVSTDFVFDGEKGAPYAETDEPNPIGAYARSKRNGEVLSLDENQDMIVARTSWLFGANGKCFPRTILNAALHGKPLRVVADQIGSPSYTKDIAFAIANLIETDAQSGIYHIANSGIASWYELAKECMSRAGLEVELSAITTDDWPTPAVRPKFSALDSAKYSALRFGSLPSWQDAVARYVEEISPTLQVKAVGE